MEQLETREHKLTSPKLPGMPASDGLISRANTDAMITVRCGQQTDMRKQMPLSGILYDLCALPMSQH